MYNNRYFANIYYFFNKKYIGTFVYSNDVVDCVMRKEINCNNVRSILL